MNDDMFDRVLNLQLPDNDTRPVDMPDEPIRSNTDFSDLESRMDNIMNRDNAARKIQKYTRKRKKDKKGGGPKQKYDYPPDFLTKKGTLKKSHLKKAAEFRKNHGRNTSVEDTDDSAFERRHKPLERHEQKGYLVDANKVKFKNKTKKKNMSGLTKGQLDFLEGIKTGTSSPELEPKNNIFDKLPPGIDDKLFDELVFENKGRGRMGPDRCRRLREFCTLYPRTCASDQEFRDKYVKPCTEQGRHIKDDKTYQQFLDYKSAITPQAKLEARKMNTQTWAWGAKYDIPASNYAKYHMRPTEFNRNRKLGSMKKHGATALSNTLKSMNYSNKRTHREPNWAQLQEAIINNPDSLDDILGNFKVEARKHGYNDKTIDYMIRRIVDEMYIEY